MMNSFLFILVAMMVVTMTSSSEIGHAEIAQRDLKGKTGKAKETKTPKTPKTKGKAPKPKVTKTKAPKPKVIKTKAPKK